MCSIMQKKLIIISRTRVNENFFTDDLKRFNSMQHRRRLRFELKKKKHIDRCRSITYVFDVRLVLFKTSKKLLLLSHVSYSFFLL